jgi:hypothetical protein
LTTLFKTHLTPTTPSPLACFSFLHRTSSNINTYYFFESSPILLIYFVRGLSPTTRMTAPEHRTLCTLLCF